MCSVETTFPLTQYSSNNNSSFLSVFFRLRVIHNSRKNGTDNNNATPRGTEWIKVKPVSRELLFFTNSPHSWRMVLFFPILVTVGDSFGKSLLGTRTTIGFFLKIKIIGFWNSCVHQVKYIWGTTHCIYLKCWAWRGDLFSNSGHLGFFRKGGNVEFWFFLVWHEGIFTF